MLCGAAPQMRVRLFAVARSLCHPVHGRAQGLTIPVDARGHGTQEGGSSGGAPEAMGPLVGVKVLDLGQVVAGNFCGALLAYFGADVIKVEPPRGDALRTLRRLDATGTSLWWRGYGRNRRCITIDLHKEEGRAIVKRLSERVDVLVENFRPGVMERWGLGPSDLKPDLIYTRISGYGQRNIGLPPHGEGLSGCFAFRSMNCKSTCLFEAIPTDLFIHVTWGIHTGPKATMPGYASVCEAYGGFRHLNGYKDRPPVRPNFSYGDSLAGLHAAFGTVMALLHEQRNGGKSAGQVVDASISESVFNMLEGCVSEYAMHGYDRPPSGSTISDVVPSGTFRTLDDHYVVIGGNGNSVYSRLMAAIGRADMTTENPKYATDAKRCEREQEIMMEIEKFVGSNSLEVVLRAMQDARVPAGPILSTREIMQEEQYIARGMFHEAAPPSGGPKVTIPAMLPILSKTPGSTRWAGPELGEHTSDVLKTEIGLTEKELAQLREQVVI